MFTRREVAAGGVLTILFGPLSLNCQAETPSGVRSFGCMLEDDEAEQLLAISTEQQTYLTGKEPIVASSGDREFDYALAQTLSRISETFRVLPGFAYYDDHGHLNAYASEKVRMARADGTVLFGRGLLRRLLARPEAPDVAVTAVCAHEFGHILQYKLNLKKTVFARENTAKRVELHADYLAGYFAGISKLKRPDYPAAVFATTQHSAGGFRGGKGNHGTPDERAAAVVKGFEVAYRERRNLSDAVHVGVKYVFSI